MLICEATKKLDSACPDISGCELGTFLPSAMHQHVLIAPVQYSFVVAVDTVEVAMNDNAGIEKVIKLRVATQLRAMLEELGEKL